MIPWINYHHLLYFKVIAEEGSVSKAALKLRLGQPTLSAQLKQFEEALGVSLFERQHKKLILTEHGKVALDYARNIFKLGSEMYEVLHDRLAPLKPSIHIGALDSIAKQLVLQLVKSAYEISPCLVTLSEGKCDELVRELSSHKMDLLLTNFLPTATDSKALFHRIIAKKNVSVFSSSKFKGLMKHFPHSLSGQPFIVPTYDSKLRYDLAHWSQSKKIELNIIAESQDIAVNKLMAINGMGLIPAPAYAVQRQVLKGELIELGQLQGVYEELFLVTANRKIENAIAAKLMKNFEI
jgi:LysR family transcriptional activator of nhaA